MKEEYRMLESINVNKKYGRCRAVDGVSLQITPGHIYGLLGPNGSGKSTWMKIAAGLIIPDSGDMLFNGEKVGPASKASIAYMPTEPYFYSYMRISDAAKYYQDFFEDFDMQLFEKLLSDMDLTPDLKVRTLSSGMTAKLKIAITLARRADIYLLDEPLNGIDLLAREDIIRAIISCMDDQAALVISSHLVEELEKVIDMVIFMRDGRAVMSGDVEELRDKTGKSVVELYRDIYRDHTDEQGGM